MKPFIVAEMSANHLGSLKRALEIVEAAHEAGADAIKLQTWSPGTMCISDYTLHSGPWAGRKLRDLYEEAFTPWEWHKPIFDRARELGLIPFSAAFDPAAVDFLESLGVDRHKVASFELTDIPLIRYMASKGKPMILSTGMATCGETLEAVEAAWDAGCRDILTLACVSAYPADPADAYLNQWRETGAWGVSDHTLGIGVSVAAVGLGAEYVEKHLTLSRADGGPDGGFSMEPAELKLLVEECRRAYQATRTAPPEVPQPQQHTELRRSLWVKRDVGEGMALKLGANIATARPALGLPPSFDLRGKVASRPLKAGEPLTLEDVL